MKYRAELYYNRQDGKPVTKALPVFDANNDNHALHRVVATCYKHALHVQANIWDDSGAGLHHVYVNSVMGQHSGITVDDVFYHDGQDFITAFPK